MKVQVVLVNPLIPQNTGNIARLTAANRVRLHLIEPLGFELSERTVRRAGLDYWPETDVHVHKDWETFLAVTGATKNKLWFLSTKATRSLYETTLDEDCFLVFGNESSGLSAFFHENYSDSRIGIPMENPNIRSLNLANAVSIALYEVKRQNRLIKLNSEI